MVALHNASRLGAPDLTGDSREGNIRQKVATRSLSGLIIFRNSIVAGDEPREKSCSRHRCLQGASKLRKCLDTLLKRTSAGSLRGKGDRRPANFSKTAIVTENILVAAKDGAHDERIISVADLRNRIWDDVCFLGRVTKRKRSFLS